MSEKKKRRMRRRKRKRKRLGLGFGWGWLKSGESILRFERMESLYEL